MTKGQMQQDPISSRGFLVGTAACNDHLQQIALALHEAGMLGRYSLTGVDSFRSPPARLLRGLVERALPPLHRKLLHRSISCLPSSLVESDWTWDFWRSLVHSTGGSENLKDWLWEKSELHLDHKCASELASGQYRGFIGTEFGSLASIAAAKALGLPGAVVYMSPHHTAYDRWVAPEFARFPELNLNRSPRIQKLTGPRNARRDREARAADLLVSNSGFTTETLVQAGFDSHRIITVPLACAPHPDLQLQPAAADAPVVFLYAGSVSVHKGVHLLLEAWKNGGFRHHAQLHLYGTVQLPAVVLRNLPDNVHFHGRVPRADLASAFRQASVMVFPTLLDGFGLVVTEALANGLPVITTRNAGAADLIHDGYNGFVLDAGNPDQLLQQMRWCMENRQALLDMKENCLATARANNWSRFRSEFREAFFRALGISEPPLQGPRPIA